MPITLRSVVRGLWTARR